MAKKASNVATTDNFTPEEQKQFDSMKEVDTGSEESQTVPEPTEQPKQPEPEAKTPPKTEPEPKQIKEPKENTMVPHAALESERQKRKAAEQRDREREVEFAKLQERLNLLNQAIESTQKKPEKPTKLEVPDPDKDALGALKAVTNNLKLTEEENRLLREAREKRESEEKSQQERQKQTEAENGRVRAELSRASAEEAEFAARTPDFQDAANHIRNLRRQQLQAMGFTDQPQYDPQTFSMTRPSIDQMIGQDLLQMARNAQALNKNAGEFLYSMAKASGYQMKPTEQPTSPAQNPQPTQPSAAEQIDRLAAAQRANRSLSEASGNAPPGKFSAKDLANMSDEKFKKVLASMSQEEQYEYFGN